MAMRNVQLASLAALLALAPAAHAEIYKWVDDKGVVNYGEHPPPQGKARVVAPERTPLTVYPAPTGSTAVASVRESALDARVEQLERQLARERQERENSAALAAEREAQRLERCQRERRVDCSEEALDVGYPTVVIHRPPRWLPHRHSHPPHRLRPPRALEPEPRRALRMPVAR